MAGSRDLAGPLAGGRRDPGDCPTPPAGSSASSTDEPITARELADLATACGLAGSTTDALAAVAAIGTRWLPIGRVSLAVPEGEELVVRASWGEHAPGPVGLCTAPVHWRGRRAGVLTVTAAAGQLHEGHQRALGLIADTIGPLVFALDEVERLRHQARTDELTGLPNRAAVYEALRRLLAAGQVALLAMDVDNLKTVNDSRGHAAGDALLREMAAGARAALRASDVVGRWGGDEFVMLLPHTPARDAVRVAERVQHQVAPLTTVSIGLAVGAAGEDADYVLERADLALYSAKRGGRAQVRVSVPEPGLVAPEQ